MREVIEKALAKSKTERPYREALRKLDDIGLKINQARTDLTNAIREQQSSTSTHRAKVNPIEAEALKLLGHSAPPVIEANQPKNLDELRHRLKVLEAALPMQETTVRELQRTRANELGPLLRKQHEPMVARAARALQEAAEVFAEQRSLVEAIEGLGLYASPHMCSMDSLGLEHYRGSKLAAWLGKARERGYNV